jgi:hypothetical protein
MKAVLFSRFGRCGDAAEPVALRLLDGSFVQRMRRCDRRRVGLRVGRLRHRRFDPAAFAELRADRDQAHLGPCEPSRCVPLAASLDHIGPMTRSAADAGLMLEAMAGFDQNDPSTLSTPVDD